MSIIRDNIEDLRVIDTNTNAITDIKESSLSKVASNVILENSVDLTVTQTLTNAKLPYTDGRDTTNGAYNVFTQSYTGSVDFSTCPDGIHYVALDSNNAPKFYKEPKVGIDGFNVWFDKDSGKWYEPYSLVTNGTFDTDTSGWTYTAGVAYVSGGQLNINRNNVSYTEQPKQVINTKTNLEYIVKFSVSSISSGASFAAEVLGADGTTETNLQLYVTEAGTYSFRFKALEDNHFLLIAGSGATDAVVTCDNISVTPVEYDTSILTELSNPISFIDDKPYQVASGTPMDRLVDYPSIPKNVMESTYVDGDLEVSGALTISETKWSNEDGVEYFDAGLLGVPDTTFSSTGARIYPDGTIRGKSSYGEYVKSPNGDLECMRTIPKNTSIPYHNSFNNAILNISCPSAAVGYNYLSACATDGSTFEKGDYILTLASGYGLLGWDVLYIRNAITTTYLTSLPFKVRLYAKGTWK